MSTQLNLFDEYSLYEGIDIEYKAGKGGLPNSLWETYSAFANTEGGTIWLGVSQKSQNLDVHGVPDAQKLVGDFWNTVNGRSKVNINLLNQNDVSIIPLPKTDAQVVRINVPRADRRQRPVFVGSDPFSGTFRRNHEGDYHCTEQEVRRMFADQSEEPADSRILEGFSLDDLHPESLRQFRNRFASNRPGHVWLAEDDQGLLHKLGGWRRDRSNGKEGLTLAALLMFGRDQAIREPAAIPGFHLDYRERFSEDPSIRWTDRLTLDGTWEGNLFQFYQQVTLKLSSGPGIKRPFRTDVDGYRISGTSVVEALQEALVNALIHTDFSGQGGIVIDRYIDRFEFTNPGTLLVSREQLLRGAVSECRNKSLQLMFQMLGAGDKAGSGIDKIRSSWTAERWQSPSLRETHRPDRVVLELPMISTLPENVLNVLGEYFGDGFDNLNSDEVQAIVTAYVEGGVTNQRLQDMLALHRVDITKMLRGLVKDGYLASDGVGRGTSYSVTASIPSGAFDRNSGNFNLEDSTPPSSSPPKNEAYPLSSPPSLTTGKDHQIYDSELLAIAASIRDAKRVSPQVLRQAILNLCEKQFLTIKQLAGLLGRGGKKIRDSHVNALVDAKLLELRFPNAPQHPDQAYRAVRQINPTNH